jgi:hypothetical protein
MGFFTAVGIVAVGAIVVGGVFLAAKFFNGLRGLGRM